MLTSERPTIDPCILGSAIGDLLPENPSCRSDFLIVIKKEREHCITMKVRINV